MTTKVFMKNNPSYICIQIKEMCTSKNITKTCNTHTRHSVGFVEVDTVLGTLAVFERNFACRGHCRPGN